MISIYFYGNQSVSLTLTSSKWLALFFRRIFLLRLNQATVITEI